MLNLNGDAVMVGERGGAVKVGERLREAAVRRSA
ncbi:hypothetical protein L195_g027074, partial [Trifolium pratense]